MRLLPLGPDLTSHQAARKMLAQDQAAAWQQAQFKSLALRLGEGRGLSYRRRPAMRRYAENVITEKGSLKQFGKCMGRRAFSKEVND